MTNVSRDKSLKQLILDLNLCISQNPRGTDKLWPHTYIEGFYDVEFGKRRASNPSILEIGFRHGASIFLWSNYFASSKIIGLDNGSDVGITERSPVNNDWLSSDNVDVMIGDAYDQEFSRSVDGKFDIIIDDGPHSLESQIKFLRLYLNKLAPNGVAIIEDLQKWGGLIIWPLMLNTPLNYHIEFYDFRKISGLGDDMLYVVRRLPANSYFSRIKALGFGLRYLATDGAKKILNLFHRIGSRFLNK